MKPAAILSQLLPLLPKGRALDLACGAGRNAIYLAARGWNVTAIDASRSALDLLRSSAESHSIRVSSSGVRNPADAKPATPGRHIDLIEADLEEFHILQKQFDLIICIDYLQRSIFAAIEEALLPGGVLLYETFTSAQLQFASGPRNPSIFSNPASFTQHSRHLLRFSFARFAPGRESSHFWRVNLSNSPARICYRKFGVNDSGLPRRADNEPRPQVYLLQREQEDPSVRMVFPAGSGAGLKYWAGRREVG